MRLSNYEHAGDLNSVIVRLNGRQLPQTGTAFTAADMHFHVLKEGPISPYGYILRCVFARSLLLAFMHSSKTFWTDFRRNLELRRFELLDLLPLVRCGENRVSVELTKRDLMIEIQIELVDVDLEVKYLPHRHFQRQPLRF